MKYGERKLLISETVSKYTNVISREPRVNFLKSTLKGNGESEQNLLDFTAMFRVPFSCGYIFFHVILQQVVRNLRRLIRIGETGG